MGFGRVGSWGAVVASAGLWTASALVGCGAFEPGRDRSGDATGGASAGEVGGAGTGDLRAGIGGSSIGIGGSGAGTGGGSSTGGSGTGGGSSDWVTVADALDALISAALEPCACAGPGLEDDCRADVLSEPIAFDPCESQALSVSAAQPTLRCMVEEADTYTSCVRAADCDFDVIQRCVDAFAAHLDACEVAPSVDQALEDCAITAGDAFTCANGRTIPADYRCDGWDDCGDDSDETGC
ncbi:MAG: hypothetical protein JW751_25290 [Polyangiaceae bacterium]|nr:hypothetical protein [Polyangiaceae bacterium]